MPREQSPKSARYHVESCDSNAAPTGPCLEIVDDEGTLYAQCWSEAVADIVCAALNASGGRPTVVEVRDAK